MFAMCQLFERSTCHRHDVQLPFVFGQGHTHKCYLLFIRREDGFDNLDSLGKLNGCKMVGFGV